MCTVSTTHTQCIAARTYWDTHQDQVPHRYSSSIHYLKTYGHCCNASVIGVMLLCDTVPTYAR